MQDDVLVSSQTLTPGPLFAVAWLQDGGIAALGQQVLADSLVRADAQGLPLWTLTWTTKNSNSIRGLIAMTDGGMLVGGRLADTGWLARISASGQTLWTKTLPVHSVQALAVAGPAVGLAGTDAAGHQWLGRVDLSGNLLSEHTFTSLQADAQAIAASTAGGWLLTSEVGWTARTDALGVAPCVALP